MDLRYPVGPFSPPADPDATSRRDAIAAVAAVPERVRAAVRDLTDDQLDTPYRPGGWTVRQLVHHLADSHLNALTRLKLALTEDQPTIKPYDQEAWARLPDSREPIEPSLLILDGLHRRWAALLNALSPDDFERTWDHPEDGVLTIDGLLALYAWHGKHHVAHITSLRDRQGW